MLKQKGNPALFHDVANASAIVMYKLKADAITANLKLPREEAPLRITQVGYTK